MHRALLRTIVAGSLLTALAACQPRPAVEPATLIVHNARIYTVDDTQPDAEAVAVRGDRIVLVGTNARRAGAARRQRRASSTPAGATILPGLQDAHGHFTGLGASLQALHLRGTTSYEQIVEMVAPARRDRAAGRVDPRAQLGSERLGGQGLADARPAERRVAE